MNTSTVCLIAVATAFFTGCAVSPDYSNYDWHSHGGIVQEQDQALASARIEPFQRRIVRANEPLTPVGAPPSRSEEVRIGAAPRPIARVEVQR